MTGTGKTVSAGGASQAEIDAFLRRVAAAPAPQAVAGGRGRLMFAIDATASRQPTWDRARQLQREMFEVTAALGGLDIQLVYFRGYGECKASPWLADATDLGRRMAGVECLAGHTQWCRVLGHAATETRRGKVGALVCVGDACEEEIDRLGDLAGQLGLLGVPAFCFHEGPDLQARLAFEQVAKLTGGAYCPFDGASARQLRDLLSAVAVYAAGGLAALADFGQARGGAARVLTDRLAKPQDKD
ncbi:MAG: VWA domain-containing protein [Rhodospirillaceae bacterium]